MEDKKLTIVAIIGFIALSIFNTFLIDIITDELEENVEKQRIIYETIKEH